MPIRVRPASASTTAPYSPLITFFTLVSTLPLIGLTSRSGLYLASCTARRRLLVPTTEPGASSLSFWPLSLTSTSFGLALFGMHATTSSSDRSDGTSFKLWTAKSASPFLTASLTSFSKIPFSSMVKSGRLSTSPLVFIVITSKRTPACTLRKAASAISVCAIASRLPLVPTRIVFISLSCEKLHRTLQWSCPYRLHCARTKQNRSRTVKAG